MDIPTPKVFISYSWSSAERVKELAERLIHDGIDILIDIADLKEGQDKYAFMEKCVTDETVTKVLMICDKSYADKANERKGGVGDETVIISAEVYGKVRQEKFIPVIFERDENGNEHCPAYLKSRIYIDLSEGENYEKNYESLLRNLHNKPAWSKPPLGKMPEYLNDEKVSLTTVRASIKQLQSYEGKNSDRIELIMRKFIDNFIVTLKEYAPVYDKDFGNNLLKQIDCVKPLRDLYLEFLESITYYPNTNEFITLFFECMYNATHDTTAKGTYNHCEFEFFDFIVWEIFICTTAILLHHERYEELNRILLHTYFLGNTSYLEIKEFTSFRAICNTIENDCKPKSKNPNLRTLAGNILVSREKSPLITKQKQSLANADLVLYQMSCMLKTKRMWFPSLWCYYQGIQQIWLKMKSKTYCKKILPLFGVSTIDEMKEIIVNSSFSGSNYAYADCMSIYDSIRLEEIAALN